MPKNFKKLKNGIKINYCKSTTNIRNFKLIKLFLYL